jgi:hypothetical protein
VLTVRNAAGEVVRRLESPGKAGFQRIAWDLRYATHEPWSEQPEVDRWRPPQGVMAAPGTYTVSLAKRIDGALVDLEQEQSFEVVPWRDPAIPGAPADETVAFLKRLGDLDREVQSAGRTIDETATRLRAIRETLPRSTVEDTALDDRVRALEDRLAGLKLVLSGDPRRALMSQGGPVPIRRRLDVAKIGNRYSLYGPTPTHVRSFEIASERFAALERDLATLVETDLADLERDVEAAGLPWTPGR